MFQIIKSTTLNSLKSLHMTWHDIQESINNCSQCKPEHLETLSGFYGRPARPPEPRKGDLMFVSEVPPAEGGFWEENSDDALRRNLCSVVLSQTRDGKSLLDSFRARHFTLVQTMKWPFLSKSVESIRHSARSHIANEISFVQPKGIIALGGVAGRALQILYPESSFAKSFKWWGGTLSPDMRAGTYEAGGHEVRITYLPVDRVWNRFASLIRSDIQKFVKDLEALWPYPTNSVQ